MYEFLDKQTQGTLGRWDKRKAGAALSVGKKRICDFILALVGLCLTLPALVVIGLILLTRFGRPVLYRDQRMGRYGRSFVLYKFRTLSHDAAGIAGSQDVTGRINKNGTPHACQGGMCRFLRKYSLDELPQLWNILIGDMALVGPRPMPADELQYRFGSDASKVLSVRPGLTGLWQVSGRNDLSIDERRGLDLLYVRRHSSQLDLRIILKTVRAVLSGRGAY